MKSIKDIVCYDNNKLYDFSIVVDNFKESFGFDIDEMELFFNQYSSLKWEDIIKELSANGFSCSEILNREFTYKFYEKTLFNLKSKGNELISLVRYLKEKRVIDYDVDIEDKLKCVEVSHFGSLLSGKSINKILVVIYHLLNNFNNALDNINSIDNYLDNKKLISRSAVVIDGDIAYPSDSLIVYDDEYRDLLDKTSFIVNSNNFVKKKAKIKIGN